MFTEGKKVYNKTSVLFYRILSLPKNSCAIKLYRTNIKTILKFYSQNITSFNLLYMLREQSLIYKTPKKQKSSAHQAELFSTLKHHITN